MSMQTPSSAGYGLTPTNTAWIPKQFKKLQGAIDEANRGIRNAFRLRYGLVTGISTAGLTVQFDGDTTASGPFAYASGYTPFLNDHVILGKHGGQWVIFDSIREFPGTGPVSVIVPTTRGAYADGYNAPLRATRTADGIIVLDGMITGSGWRTPEIIGQLPVGFRPDYRLQFGINNNDNPRSIDIDANGNIIVQPSYVDGYISFSGICFPAAGVANWVTSGITFANGWGASNVTGYLGYGPTRTWLDPHGNVWVQGQVAGGSTTANVTILTLPSSSYAGKYDNYLVQTSAGGYGTIGNGHAAQTLNTEPNLINTWLSLDKTWYETPASDLVWTPVTFKSGWVDYGGNFAPTAYTKLANGLVRISGFVKSGTIGGNTVPIFTLPPGYRPGRKLIFDAVSWDGFARINVDPDGSVYCSTGNNGWVSMMGQLVFLAEV